MKKLSVILIISLLFSVSCRAKRFDDEAAISIKNMTLEQKVGQMLIVALPGSSMNSRARDIIRTWHPGGVILFGFNIKGRKQVTSFLKSLQNESYHSTGIPLFISVDQEGGRVTRFTEGVTQFPGNMAAGVARDKDLVYRWGRILGVELRAMGVNMNLAPDIDVNNNPDNPVINIRSFGSDPGVVSEMGAAYVKGLQKSRCIAVVKHFPGHGDTDKDSHKTLPVINHTMERLRKVELLPFKETIKAGADGVMSAHISYPAILPSGESATLSKLFLTDILRKEMKYKGLVLTDDMEMQAVSGRMAMGDAAVKAINAGADIILISTFTTNIPAIVKSLKEAVESGKISMERIDRSVRRILEVKMRYNIARYDKEKNKILPGNWQASDREKDIVKNARKVNTSLSEKALYFQGNERLLGSIYRERIIVTADGDFAREALHYPRMSVVPLEGIDEAVRKFRGETIIVYHEHRSLKPSRGIINYLQEVSKRHGIPYIVIATGNPFPIAKMKEIKNVLYSFSNTPASQKAILKALNGKMTVKLKIDLKLLK